jgi:gluconokinase
MTAVVVMGVTGSGKSTVGALLAEALGGRFTDADELHPPANREKMRAGIPLDDADRAPWLESVGAVLAEGGVVACSALKRRYRDGLRRHAAGVVFVHLAGDAALVADRLAGRTHAYMPASLLASQLDAFEPLQADEPSIVVDIGAPPAQLVARILNGLSTKEPA